MLNPIEFVFGVYKMNKLFDIYKKKSKNLVFLNKKYECENIINQNWNKVKTNIIKRISCLFLMNNWTIKQNEFLINQQKHWKSDKKEERK